MSVLTLREVSVSWISQDLSNAHATSHQFTASMTSAKDDVTSKFGRLSSTFSIVSPLRPLWPPKYSVYMGDFHHLYILWKTYDEFNVQRTYRIMAF